MGLKRTQGQKRKYKKGTRKQQNKRTGKRKTAKKNLRRKRQTKRRLKGGANTASIYQQEPIENENTLTLNKTPYTLALKDYEKPDRIKMMKNTLEYGKAGDKVKIYEESFPSEKFHLFNIINKDNGEKGLSYIETSESNGEVKILDEKELMKQLFGSIGPDEKGLMEELFGSIGPTLSPVKTSEKGVRYAK
jgi:hypothetical protein